MSEVLANGETLRAAAKCGDTLRVVSLLNSVTSEQKYNMLMLQESDGDTAISLAALRGHTETVKAILDSVTSDQKYNLLMLQDTYGITAILCAALYGHTETVEAILKSVTSEQKYNILMFQDSSGNTAISYATCKGHIETVKAILESVAAEQKYNMLILQNRYGDTAISRAAVYGLTEKVKYILYSVSLDKRHKMLKIQNTDGYTSLHHAASQGHIHTFRSIIASLSTEQRDALLAVRDRNGLLAVEPNEKPPLTQEVVFPTSADVTAVALLSDKKKIEYDRERTSAELEDARTKVRKCEEKLQALSSKELVTTQERKDLERKLEAYTEAVEKLEKKQLALDEELEKCHREKEKIYNKHARGRSVRDEFPQVTTLAKQAEDDGEQEAGSFYIETAVDKGGIKAQPYSNVYTQEITKQKEINTRFGREIKADVGSDEVARIRAEQEMFTIDIENLVADVEKEPTYFAYIQGETNEVEINTPYEGGIKEPDVQIEPQAEHEHRNVEPLTGIAEPEEKHHSKHKLCCFPFNC